MNTDNRSPAQQPANLAPVYLDDQPITLQDAQPKVSAILSAGGKPETTDVKWLQQPNTQGKALRSEEVLDRTTDPSKPIYLTSTSKAAASADWKGKDAGQEAAAGANAGNPASFGSSTALSPTTAPAAAGETAASQAKSDDTLGLQDDANTETGESGRTATSDQ
ncbi:MAG TPA: hypothetical protein VM327_00315 [Candidatus Thermoplasmatota archaeon]|nr:hypothetical protein [Candidatus Thermoplasmatota archaeon]